MNGRDAAGARPCDDGGAGDLGPPRAGETLDVERLGAWLRANVAGLEGAPSLRQFRGGYANLTYELRFAERAVVVRRPPHGPLPRGAHDMARERAVLAGLSPRYRPAPAPLAYCDDPGVIGAAFLVMERREGVVVRRAFPPELADCAAVERRTAFALMDALADLHAIDPVEVGLGGLGRPDGFAARQVAGWARRWETARDRDVPAFDRVAARLAAGAPAPLGVSVLHNDPKLDNCMFAPGAPDRVRSMFDWDMATLGDPLVDLGVALGYFAADRGAWGGMFSATTVSGDYPSQEELADRYLARAGLPVADVAWATAFGLWKTAVVLQQIYARWLAGATSDARFEGLGPRVPELIEKAEAALG
ncbi:phosphotransferase family protein [Rubrimonas cliftonensis]|uniref:Predicted kinase, aminoglycoside phosphotransferase (APT) family n=1 Tax=Rubrimonas cliftonensis TaxID=89524 RepID=A0A1H3X0U0_9RHOB|nr:phosphotransferase family protein [Rubrimonas cliftonensis]SDZ93019.1 Predicted kinase, aminoglycoside phosphotransferase (APT) family [Rubrimonas cliftonensis]